MLPKDRPQLTKRVCVRHGGVKTLRIDCDGIECNAYVVVPVRKGKSGGVESHEWAGCMYVLDVLFRYAVGLGLSVEDLLGMNR